MKTQQLCKNTTTWETLKDRHTYEQIYRQTDRYSYTQNTVCSSSTDWGPTDVQSILY